MPERECNGGRLVFVKRLTTPQERTMARVALPNFAETFD
jgi:hypothetical protein